MGNGDLAQLERGRLCDLLLEVGPDHPTLCEGWTAADLAAHLVIRERKPLAAPGIVMGGKLGDYSEKVRLATRDGSSFADLVTQVRRGPPAPLRPLDGAINLSEYFIHLEDLRRGDGTRGPRPVDEVGEVEDALWAMQGRRTKFLTRSLDDVDLTLALPDGETKAIGGGSRPVTLTGRAGELTLFLSGRRGRRRGRAHRCHRGGRRGPNRQARDLRRTPVGVRRDTSPGRRRAPAGAVASSPVRRLWAHLREINPVVVDGLLALVVLVPSLAGLATDPTELNPTPIDPLAVLLTVVGIGVLAVRRSRPLLTLWVSMAAAVIYTLRDYVETGIPVAVLIALYTAALLVPRRKWLPAAGVIVAFFFLMALFRAEDLSAGNLAGNLAIFGIAAAFGDSNATRRATTQALELRAETLEQNQAILAEQAVAEERLRIARQLHDVVAHALAVIAVQSGVGGHVIDEDPAEAKRVLDNINQASRETLDEMRRMLGVLRGEDGVRATLAPAPSLSDLDQLVKGVRDAGVEVTVELTGDGERVPPSVELTAYRIIQEALTNVLKHAGPARAEVHVDRGHGVVKVEICDDGRGAAATPDPGVTATWPHRHAGARHPLRRRVGGRPQSRRRLAGPRRPSPTSGSPHDPGPGGRRPAPGAGRVPGAHRLRARLRGRGRGRRPDRGGRPGHPSTDPTSCSWTSACPSWTASRPPGASWPTRPSPAPGCWCSRPSTSTSTCSTPCGPAPAASC